MPRLYDLSVRFVSRWIFNCYIVEDGGVGRPLVVDPGLPCTAEAAAHELAELEAQALAIASTHGHSDHVGGIPTLVARGDTAVYLPRRCADYLSGETPRSPGLREVVKILPVLGEQPFDARAAREFATEAGGGYGRSPRMTAPFTVDGYLDDGRPLEAAPAWEVIHAPGHTDDSTCLYHRDSATLIAGDAVLSLGGRAWLNPEVVDPALANETEARLRSLDVRHLLPGHGLPIEGRHLMRDARSFATRPASRGWRATVARAVGRW